MKILIVLLALLGGSTAGADWAAVSKPTVQSPQAHGFYSAGCLAGAEALPAAGPGYRVMRRSRNRYYGHPTLIRLVEALGRQAVEQGLAPILVGDLSQPRGGPMSYGHSSHQIGLDVDIWFRPGPPGQTLTREQREHWELQSAVDRQQWVVNHRFGPRERQLLELAATTPGVERIFVNPAIKLALCQTVTGPRDWLARLRPWWGHDEHFHIRLACPDDSSGCRSQDPVPLGDGCDGALAWVEELRNPPKVTK
ncbi:MAG: penicillin-insensitive murein endopeptidase, partial [Candidatus Competibacteraceae bacterium]|nr:penicillin-insensitive murein endopeptidase [Candidatus Competibacteraceae bacterium]